MVAAPKTSKGATVSSGSRVNRLHSSGLEESVAQKSEHAMHWVNRGDEPLGLKQIRKVYTRRWITFYRNNQGKKTDGREVGNISQESVAAVLIAMRIL